jgi:hypothetical protein
MNPSDLENIWNEQGPIKPDPKDIAKIADAVRSGDRKFRRTIWWRDLREVGAALILAAVFGNIGQTGYRWIAVASCLFVAGFIIRSRLGERFRADQASVADQVQQMIRGTETQIRLLRSVFWWYLLPCAIGTLAIVLDRASAQDHLPRRADPFHLPIFFATMIMLSIGVYWLNQRAVRKHLEPRRASLRQMLAELRQQS